MEQRILSGIAAGKSLKALADEFNVSDVAILRRVEDDPNYKPYRRIGLQLRMGQREQELESAADNVSVTRADRLLGHARWLAERLDSETFGQKSHMTADLNVSVTIARGVVIEGEAAQQIEDVAPHNPESEV